MGSVIFDCDSTLSAIEGIEYISRAHQSEVERLTAAAMNGDVPLEAVYGKRLELVRPGRDVIQELGNAYIDALMEDAREVVDALRQERIQVRVLSGGLLPGVLALTRALNVEDEAVAAVPIHFDARGAYAGFDEASPLARSGGKLDVVSAWRRTLPGPIMLVGDGITDAEARPAVDVFVAFAGVVARKTVTDQADYVIRTASLAPVLPLALGRPPRGRQARMTYEKGLALLQQRGSERFPEPESERV